MAAPKNKNSEANLTNAERGRIVRSKRLSICLAIRHLADRMHVSICHLSAMERGEKSWSEMRYRLALNILKNMGAE